MELVSAYLDIHKEVEPYLKGFLNALKRETDIDRILSKEKQSRPRFTTPSVHDTYTVRGRRSGKIFMDLGRMESEYRRAQSDFIERAVREQVARMILSEEEQSNGINRRQFI